jgi:rhamnose transport system ATP-binding protein
VTGAGGASTAVDDRHATGQQPLVTLRGVGKSFSGTRILREIDLEIRRGEVHALVGENGAGKSTLMKILAGVHHADEGRVEIDGAPVAFSHPVQAQRSGISTVFQEFNLLPERTVAENIYLGREPRRFGLVDGRRMIDDTAATLERLGVHDLSPRARVGTLSVAQQQVVEIAKAVSADARLVSMDEPTAALADAEVDLLYRLVRQLRADGVSVLYVSHRLREIFDLSDRTTVLKDGHLVTTVETSTLDANALVRLMVGRDLEQFFPPAAPGTSLGEVRLHLDGVGNATVDDIDLEVRSGEIVGLAGLQGSGRSEIALGTFGIAPFTRGEVKVAGEVVHPSPARSARNGVALVSEDRKVEGLALNQTVSSNARLVIDGAFAGRGRARIRAIPEVLRNVELVSRHRDPEVRHLSGGNQQKVVLAKWLVVDPTVIILDEPTRGIDVGARRAIYELMRSLVADGAAILMISSELPELLGMADRIVVLHEGRIAGEQRAEDATEASIMSLATGNHPEVVS